MGSIICQTFVLIGSSTDAYITQIWNNHYKYNHAYLRFQEKVIITSFN